MASDVPPVAARTNAGLKREPESAAWHVTRMASASALPSPVKGRAEVPAGLTGSVIDESRCGQGMARFEARVNHSLRN